MWPSLKHPHYGVFVENTYRELLRDGLDVSKIAICKHDTLFGKLKEYAFFFIKVVLGIVIIAGRLPRRSTLSCHTVPRRAASC